jgi:putative membrane protein
MKLSDLPTINACLNGASAVLLAFGYYFIRRGNRIAHRNCMISAFATSTVFLVCYLVYHYFAGRTVFREPLWFRPIYIVLLTSHTILAVVIVPLILITLNRALKARYELHKKIARWTWPLWMYVSVTGVLVYLILYHFYPQR